MFIPVLLMGGMVGRVFREFAVTIAVAIIVSGFVSLTLTPMLCARVLRTPSRGREAERRAAHVRGDVQRLAARPTNGRSTRCSRYKFDHAAGHARHDGRHGLALHRHPEGLLPDRGHRLHLGHDRGRRPISRSAPWSSGSSAVAEIIRQDPAVDYVNSTVGVGGPNADHQYRPHVRRAQAARASATASATVIAAAAPHDQQRRRHGGLLPRRSRTSISAAASPRASSSTRCSRATTETLYRVAPTRCSRRSRRSTGLRDVNSDLYIKNPQIEIEIDREKAAFYGISVDQIRQELYNAFGTRQVATIYTPINDYQVILETRPEFQADTDRAVEDLSQDQSRQHRQRRGDRPAAASSAPARRTACRSRSAR